MAMSSGYKPSPLGYGSPRSSPFRRPVSPGSPSALRQSTPPASTARGVSLFTPSRLSSAGPFVDSPDTKRSRSFAQPNEMLSPSLGSPPHIVSRGQPMQQASHGNALSHLQPSQVRVLREGFQILDRDSDGAVNREDIVDMLNQLGLPSSPQDIAQFFPPGGPQTMTLAAFLNSLATGLAAMSPSAELLSAFSAFDDDDSGQVDLAELRDALLQTAPEPGERTLTAAEVERIMAGFSGRRAFSKSMNNGLSKRGEVFKYQEFVNSIMGGSGSSEPASREGSET